MSERLAPDRYPWWIKLTFMAGGRTRRGQWFYVAASLVAAAICAGLPFALQLRASTAALLAFGALAFLVCAAWYLASIRWLDAHGRWG